MLKETRNKGIWSGVLLTLVMVIFGALFLALAMSEPSSSSDNSIQVSYIYPEYLVETDADTAIYLIGDESYGYMGLEASPDDKDLQALLEAGDSLLDNPQTIEAAAISVSDEDSLVGYTSFMQETFASETEVLDNLELLYYVSIPAAKKFEPSAYLFPVVFFVAAGASLFFALRTRKTNVGAYETLYAAYPELSGNLELLRTNAAVINETLGVLIYKNHLVSYKQSVFALDLTNTKQLYLELLTYKMNFVLTVNRFSYLIAVTKDDKNHKFRIGSLGAATGFELEPITNYIQANFPDVKIGYEE